MIEYKSLLTIDIFPNTAAIGSHPNNPTNSQFKAPASSNAYIIRLIDLENKLSISIFLQDTFDCLMLSFVEFYAKNLLLFDF